MLTDGGQNFDCCSSFTEFIHGARPRPVELTLPKFNISQTHTSLKKILQNLGINDVFNQGSADLSGIDGERDLFVSDIAHKVTVAIDEKGAEAAEATAIKIEALSAVFPSEEPIRIKVDRPFIITISDDNLDFITAMIYSPNDAQK